MHLAIISLVLLLACVECALGQIAKEYEEWKKKICYISNVCNGKCVYTIFTSIYYTFPQH